MGFINFIHSLPLLAAEGGDAAGDTVDIIPGKEIGIGQAFLVLFICMAFILFILIVMMGILYLFKLFPKIEDKLEARKALKEQEEQSEQSPASLMAAADEDEEIAAVIAAVTAICMESGAETSGAEAGISAPFRIKNIRRIK